MRKPSWTGTRLVHPDYDDHYGLDDGGLSEAAHVFVDSARLVDRFSAMQPGDRFVVGELGMGAARNLLAVWRCFETHAPARATLDIYTLESHPLPGTTP
jgi:tRNA 5-methylaminomethyl-2-thiouridine biosynthesis bifunctional protein